MMVWYMNEETSEADNTEDVNGRLKSYKLRRQTVSKAFGTNIIKS